MTTPMTGGGFTVHLPAEWEGRIFRRPTPVANFAPDNQTPNTVNTQRDSGWPGGVTRTVVHLANFALPPDRGDYGSGAVERMGPQHSFVALIEFGPECLGTALYSSTGLPRTSPRLFSPNGLQRRIEGQAGCQFFFTEQGRPLCLYVVIGSYEDANTLSSKVNQVLDQIQVDAR